MAPSFHIRDSAEYIILNRETADLLRAEQNGKHTVIVDNPENWSGGGDEGFSLKLQHHHHLTFAIQFIGGPTYLGASRAGIVTYDTTLNPPKANEWWKVRHLYQSAHSTFIKIESVDHGTYLDVVNDKVVCTDLHDGQSQQWKLHLVGTGADLKETGITAQRKLKEEKMEEQRAQEQAAQSSTYPNYYGGSSIATNNICGNPTCGVDHTCAADYNRRVQPMGYPGVPGF